MSHSPEFEAAAAAICDAMLKSALGLMRDGHPPGVVVWAMASVVGNLLEIVCRPEELAAGLAQSEQAMRAGAYRRALAQQPPAGTA